MKTYTFNKHLKIVITNDQKPFFSAYDYETSIPIGDIDSLIEKLESIQSGKAQSDDELYEAERSDELTESDDRYSEEMELRGDCKRNGDY